MTVPIGIQGSHYRQTVTTGTYVAGFKIEGTTATTLSITQANMGNVASGNLLVAFVLTEFDIKSGSWMTLPTGFTQRATLSMYSGGVRLLVGTKVAGGSEGTYTTGAGSAVSNSHFHLVEASGVTQYANISTYQSGNDFFQTDITIPSISVTPGGFIVGHYASGETVCTITTSPGTGRLSFTSGTSGYAALTFTDQMASSGATGAYLGDRSVNVNSVGQSGAFVVLN